jgi:molecular chaperone GrpE
LRSEPAEPKVTAKPKLSIPKIEDCNQADLEILYLALMGTQRKKNELQNENEGLKQQLNQLVKHLQTLNYQFQVQQRELEEAQQAAANGQQPTEDLTPKLDDLRQRLSQAEQSKNRLGHEMAQEKVFAMVQGLLPTLDAFENLTVQAEKSQDQVLVTCIAAVSATFQSLLAGLGIEKMANLSGQDFDPNFHQACAVQASTEHGPGKIITVLQPGYRLDKRVIRYPLVIVCNNEEAT